MGGRPTESHKGAGPETSLLAGRKLVVADGDRGITLRQIYAGRPLGKPRLSAASPIHTKSPVHVDRLTQKREGSFPRVYSEP